MSSRQQQAFEYFVRMGWSPAQSAGIVANFVRESNLDPRAVGDGGLARGVAQWHPNRREGFQALIGKPFEESTLEEQLYWAHAELQSTEKAAGDALRECRTAAEAGACVSMRYERPADTEGEAAKRAALAETILATYGGTVGVAEPGLPPPVPAPVSDTTATLPRPEKPMFAALLPVLLGLIPQLTPILGPKTAGKVEQYGQLAAAITNAITQATGTANLQAGLEAMQSDPAVKAKTATAVLSEPTVAAVMESQEAGGGGIGGARKVWADPNAAAFYKTGPFWISILLLLIPYGALADVLFLHPSNWTPSDRSQILMLAVAVTSGVMGYFLGSSIGSAQSKAIALASKD